MRAQVKYFFWEQIRQSPWMLVALANGLVACTSAEIMRRIPDNMSANDAVEMSDAYICFSMLMVVFGTVLSHDHRMELAVGVPTRWLRLPVQSRAMAWGWTLARLGLGLAMIAVLVLLRQPFQDGVTKLPVLQTFVYYGALMAVLHGLVRMAAAWKDGAGWFVMALFGGVVSFFGWPLWALAAFAPLTMLLVCLAMGAPLCAWGIVLRRRGGIVLGVGLGRKERKVYSRVAEIPAFADGAAAQGWLEWRRSGKVYPLLCLLGYGLVLGGMIYSRLGNYITQNLMARGEYWAAVAGVIDVPQVLANFIPVPVAAAVLTSLYLMLNDVVYARRGTIRYMRVRPLSGWTFTVARHRMLWMSVVAGLAILPVIVMILTMLCTLAQRPGYDNTAMNFLGDIARFFFAPTYDYATNRELPARGIDALAMVLVYGGMISAAVSMSNRYSLVLAAPLVFLFVVAQAYGGFFDHDPLDRGFFQWAPAIMPALLVLLVLAIGVYTGVMRARAALWSGGAWLAAALLLGLVGTGSQRIDIMNYNLNGLPLGLCLSFIVTAMPAAALGYHCRRSESWMPPRMANARAGWRDLRGPGLAFGSIAVMALVLGTTWRAVASRAMQEAEAEAARLGVAADSPARPKNDGPQRLTYADLGGLVRANNRNRITFETEPPSFNVSAMSGKDSGDSVKFILEPHAPMREEALARLESVRGELEQTVAAAEALAQNTQVSPRSKDETSGQLNQLQYSLFQCLALAVLGAERGDQALASRGLHAAQILQAGIYAEPTRSGLMAREWAAGYLVAFEFVLGRVSLPAEDLAALRALVPGPTPMRVVKEMLRPEPFSEVQERRRWERRDAFPDGLVAILARKYFMAPEITYANMLQRGAAAITKHKECLEKPLLQMYQYPEWYLAKDVFYAPNDGWAFSAHVAVHDTDAYMSLLAQVLAVEEFRARHRVYPETLEATVPEILPALPTDWSWTGKKRPCGFARNAPSVCRVWIVGKDRQDADGLTLSGRRADVVVHLERP